jgi:hypothetical protein
MWGQSSGFDSQLYFRDSAVIGGKDFFVRGASIRKLSVQVIPSGSKHFCQVCCLSSFNRDVDTASILLSIILLSSSRPALFAPPRGLNNLTC